MPPPPVRSDRPPTERLWIPLAVVATVGVAATLAVPGEWVPRFSPVEEFVAHAVAFGLGVGLWARAAPGRLGVVAAVGIGLAIGTEVLQEWVVPLRTGSVDDALADLVGLGLAIGLVSVSHLSRDEEAVGRPAAITEALPEAGGAQPGGGREAQPPPQDS